MKREKKWTRQDASRPYSGSRACASGVFNARYPAEPQSAFADAGAVRKPTGWRFPVTRFGANQQAHAWFRNCKTFSHSCDSNAVQRALHPRPGLRRPGRLPASARCHLPLPLRFPLFFFRFSIHACRYRLQSHVSPKMRFARPKNTRHRRAKTTLRDEYPDLY